MALIDVKKAKESLQEKFEIRIINVDGDTLHNSSFTKITCEELTNMKVVGSVDIEDRTFAMPLRRDDGRLFLFPVNVVNGQFTVTLNFPTTGQFVYTNSKANHDLPEPLFEVASIKIDVLRKAQ